jgi:hypothetical protein
MQIQTGQSELARHTHRFGVSGESIPQKTLPLAGLRKLCSSDVSDCYFPYVLLAEIGDERENFDGTQQRMRQAWKPWHAVYFD